MSIKSNFTKSTLPKSILKKAIINVPDVVNVDFKHIIEELINKMEILRNAFTILGLIIDSSYYHSKNRNAVVDKRRLSDSVYSIKASSYINIVIIYDLLSYLNAEMMYLKYSKGSLFTLRLNSNKETYDLYCRTSDSKPYCDQFLKDKFPSQLKKLYYNKFHDVYDELERTYIEIKNLFNQFILQQQYDGNNVVLRKSPLHTYELYDSDEKCFVGSFVNNELEKLNGIIIPFISVLKFVNDFKIAEKIDKHIVATKNNELLINYSSYLTFYQKLYKRNVIKEDLEADCFKRLQKKDYYDFIKKDLIIILKQINYNYIVQTNIIMIKIVSL
jgi:hypothetical protein